VHDKDILKIKTEEFTAIRQSLNNFKEFLQIKEKVGERSKMAVRVGNQKS
jgi:glutaredoxin-related protein